MSGVKKTVNKTYKKKFRSPMAGMSAGIKTVEKEKKPDFGLAMAVGSQKNKSNIEEKKSGKVVKKVWTKKKKKTVFNRNPFLKSKAMAGASAGVKKSDIKINLGDFGSIIKNVTGESFDLGDLGSLVKKFTGGDINLENISSLFEKVTGKPVDLGTLGDVVKKVTGNDISVAEPVKLGKGGGVVMVVIIGIAIYILSKFF